MQLNRVRYGLVLLAVIGALSSAPCKDTWGACVPGPPMNPVTDICWDCAFPLTIAGLTIIPGSYVNNWPDESNLPFCTCPAPPPLFIRIGIPIGFWEPARMVETCEVPYCFPSLGGLQLDLLSTLQAGGGTSAGQHRQGGHRGGFAQTHYFISPWWALLELLTDSVCVEMSGFDLAYISEVNPGTANDTLQSILYPEEYLVANVVAGLAQIPDAISAAAGFSLSPLWWVSGSSGNIYPLSNFKDDSSTLSFHEGLSARAQFFMGRNGTVCDPAITMCTCVPTPIWVKQHYRNQIAKPIRDFTCNPYGRTDLIWGASKNFPGSGNNFVWQQFRKRTCCSF